MPCSIQHLVRESVVSADEAETVHQGVALMAARDACSLMVTRGGEVVGLFTERDLIRRVVGQGRDPRTLRLGDVCTRDLVSIAHDSTCQAALHKMRAHNCRRLVVYRGDRLVGLVRLPDVAHELAEHAGNNGFLVNAVGGLTLLVVIGVIAMLIYQFPNMLSLAQRVSGG